MNCGNTPYEALFRDMIVSARAAGASDIHIEPTRDSVHIRFRIFGELAPPWKELSIDHRESFITEVKRISHLSIGMSGRPQDGRMSFPNLTLDARVNLLPTLYGEKIVFRLLRSDQNFSIDALFFPPRTTLDLKEAMRHKNGVILISGPTGSGKTTTLYSLLSALDKRKNNVVTLENPVEYTLPGINQVEIGDKISFASALRAVLRQDPDVIFVGEIRDEETSALAFSAAATGHLVLSTIHANGAAEVVTRLLMLGVEKYLLKENLRFSCAQRLLQRLCPACSKSPPSEVVKEIAENIRSFLGKEVDGRNFRIVGDGCDRCKGGVIGRLPILEYMTAPFLQDYFEGTFQEKETRLLGPRSPPGRKKSDHFLATTLTKEVFSCAVRGTVDVREALHVG